MASQQVSLFGGNMSVTLPSEYKDISLLREVPDNQEVFAHLVTDQSVIIEILDYLQETDDQAIRTHFNELASSNDAMGDDKCNILNVEVLSTNDLSMNECTSAYYLSGRQMVSKFNEPARNTVNIQMGLFRLSEHDTDILVSFNDPVNISPQSSSHGAVPVSCQPWTLEDFRETLRSLAIVNVDFLG